eukprot:SAG11_NODE_13786_length_639_cov_1.755556_1_plen_33_part_01
MQSIFWIWRWYLDGFITATDSVGSPRTDMQRSF